MLWCTCPKGAYERDFTLRLSPDPACLQCNTGSSTGFLMLFWELLQNKKGCKVLCRNEECFYVMSHPSTEPSPFSLHCEEKSACPYQVKHPVNLAWWEAPFPAQGDAFVIYFLKEKTFLI